MAMNGARDIIGRTFKKRPLPIMRCISLTSKYEVLAVDQLVVLL